MAEQVISNFNQFVSEKINDFSSRIRLLEEKFEQIREKLKATDQNIIRRSNELKEVISQNQAMINEINKSVKEMKETTRHLIKEVETSAKTQDLKVLEKYVDLMDPTRFLTKSEAERMFKKKSEKSSSTGKKR